VKPCIYVLTNEVNGKVYVGATINWTRRRYGHICDAKSCGCWMYPDVRKFGWGVFSVELIPCVLSELPFEERRWIAFYRSILGRDHVYNRSRGGEGPRRHRRRRSAKVRPDLDAFIHRPPNFQGGTNDNRNPR
jgi:hypothetical protein